MRTNPTALKLTPALQFACLSSGLTGKTRWRRYGRARFLQLAPIVSVLTKLPLILTRPTVLSVVLEGAVSIGMIHLSGSPQCAASLSDLHDDPRALGKAFGQLGSWAGIGVMVGPLIGSAVLRAGGGRPALVPTPSEVNANRQNFDSQLDRNSH